MPRCGQLTGPPYTDAALSRAGKEGSHSAIPRELRHLHHLLPLPPSLPSPPLSVQGGSILGISAAPSPSASASASGQRRYSFNMRPLGSFDTSTDDGSSNGSFGEWASLVPHRPVRHDPSECPFRPYEHIYCPYSRKLDALGLFQHVPGMGHPFDRLTRMKLIERILTYGEPEHLDGNGLDTDDAEVTGAGLKIHELLRNGDILAAFGLHDDDQRRAVEKQWLGTWPWAQPDDAIRQYFGERIALFFAFTAHFTTWQLLLGIIGSLAQVRDDLTTTSCSESIVHGDSSPPLFPCTPLLIFPHSYPFPSPHLFLSPPSCPYLPNQAQIFINGYKDAWSLTVFSCIVPLWAIFVIERWKRREATLALFWGMSDFHRRDLVRPEFYGEEIMSHVDGSSHLHFPTKLQRMAYTKSILVTVVCILLNFVTQWGVFSMRSWVVGQEQEGVNLTPYEWAVSKAGVAAAAQNLVLGCQIMVMEALYHGIAVRLTDRENHHFDSVYYNSLVIKLSAFQFFNRYCHYVRLSAMIFTTIDHDLTTRLKGGLLTPLPQHLDHRTHPTAPTIPTIPPIPTIPTILTTTHPPHPTPCLATRRCFTLHS